MLRSWSAEARALHPVALTSSANTWNPRGCHNSNIFVWELDLPDGDHLLALRFLHSFRRDILSRLGIAVDLARPEVCRDGIAEWLRESM